MAGPPAERIAVGLIRGLHGLRGAVRVEVLSDIPDRFVVGATLFVEGDPRPLTIAWTGPSKPGILVRFSELTSRESVEPLRDRYLEVIPDEPLPEGTWYWHQIEGLDVLTTSGEPLGRVAEIFRAGAGEVYVVRGGPRGEILVPAVHAVVKEIDPVANRLVVDATALGLATGAPDAAPDAASSADAAPGATSAG